MGGPAIAIDSPLDRAVYQRGKEDTARVLVAGRIVGIEKPKGHRIVCTPVDPAGIAGTGTTLPIREVTGRFMARVTLRAGGWHRLHLALLDGQGHEKAMAKVDHVGIGEVFITAGQSNAANSGTTRLVPRSDLVSARDRHGWRFADDPQPVATNELGSPWPAMADALVDQLHVPVGLISVGVGGTAVETWMPHEPSTRNELPPLPRLLSLLVGALGLDWDRWPWLAKLRPKTENFSRLDWAVRVVGRHGARAVLWHQGESDSIAGTSPETYARRLGAVIVASRVAAGWQVPWLVARASFHVQAPARDMESVATGQRAVVERGEAVLPGPTTDDLQGCRWRAPDRVHFNGEGLVEHGKRWARAVLDAFF